MMTYVTVMMHQEWRFRQSLVPNEWICSVHPHRLHRLDKNICRCIQALFDSWCWHILLENVVLLKELLKREGSVFDSFGDDRLTPQIQAELLNQKNSRHWLWSVWSSGLKLLAIHREPYISEEYSASIFRVQKLIPQNTNKTNLLSSSFVYSLTLIFEAVCSSEKSVFLLTTRRHKPEDPSLRRYRRRSRPKPRFWHVSQRSITILWAQPTQRWVWEQQPYPPARGVAWIWKVQSVPLSSE
jgi:hypothetical protein